MCVVFRHIARSPAVQCKVTLAILLTLHPSRVCTTSGVCVVDKARLLSKLGAAESRSAETHGQGSNEHDLWVMLRSPQVCTQEGFKSGCRHCHFSVEQEWEQCLFAACRARGIFSFVDNTQRFGRLLPPSSPPPVLRPSRGHQAPLLAPALTSTSNSCVSAIGRRIHSTVSKAITNGGADSASATITIGEDTDKRHQYEKLFRAGVARNLVHMRMVVDGVDAATADIEIGKLYDLDLRDTCR
jgi:hypothetical protein